MKKIQYLLTIFSLLAKINSHDINKNGAKFMKIDMQLNIN